MKKTAEHREKRQPMSLGLGFCIQHRTMNWALLPVSGMSHKDRRDKDASSTSQAAVLNAMLYINTLGYPVGFLGAGSEPEVLVPGWWWHV